ncbi:hypothetical protein [Chryseobacterium sp. T20]|uniref:hypothetical protein n=1 Tax=Chryseobacterium sp. T20 TaxID=3395375 RepID=UPI0039BC303C
MKKKLLLTGLLTIFSLVAKSQMGINTASPTATLDVTAKNSTGTGSAVEGILIPRVDRQKAQSMTGVPVSTLIYVNNITTGTTTGTAVNIDAVGYYYYSGTEWTKLNNPVNIYNADGTLTGNRTVTQGTNTLAFTGTQTNAFSVDGSTLSVDAANDRVGLGTATPDTKLTISTPDNSFGLNHTNGTINLKTYIGSGVASLGTTTANDLRFMTNNTQKMSITSTGDVGIGTVTPQKKLHVSGSLQLDNDLNVGGTATTAGSPGTNGQFLISKGPGIAPQWTSVSIPIPAPGTYNLRGVYNFDLNDVFTNTNGNYLTLGSFNNIKVDTGNNLVVIEFQTSTSVLTLNSGETMSYRYRLSGNNGISTLQSPFFYILPSGFNPMNNLTSYKFYLKDVPLNTYNLTLEASRQNTQGAATASKYIHFNRTYSDPTNFITDGKAIIYVYEL